MNFRSGKKSKSAQRGFITMDFIFALVASLGLAIILLAISATLSMVEVTQYVAFSISRVYAGAHETRDLQENTARKKFDQLMANRVFKTLYGGTWFKLGNPEFGNFTSEYPDPGEENEIFVGARLPMNAKIMHLNIPFIGPTAEDSETGKAVLNSYLMREVTGVECREAFTRVRYSRIIGLTADGSSPYQGVPSVQAKMITDNGC
jgi:hypothetical protein